MVVIDTRTDKAYENLSKKEAARILGVDVSTIFRWSKKGPKQSYNSFEIYFNTERRKQKRGTAKEPPKQKEQPVQTFRRP